MERKNQWWIDALIILCMVAFVYLLCQPWGRNWDEKKNDMYTGEEGVYVLDMDSYYYLRKAKEFSEGGLSSIKLFSGRSVDPMMTAVQSNTRSMDPQLLSALAALVWYFFSAFGVKISIYTIATHLCSLVLGFCTIPLYLFLKKRTSRYAAIVGALFVAIAPPFFQHSFSGIFDTDALICLFATTLVFSLYECILGKNVRNKIVNGIIACLSTVLLALTWGVFYIYVFIAIGTSIVSLLILRLSYRPKWRKMIVPLIVVIGMMIISLLFAGREILGTAISFVHPQAEQEVWPPASSFLSEMAKTKVFSTKGFWYAFMTVDSDFISYCGGAVVVCFFILSAVICCFSFVKRLKNKEKIFENDFIFLSVGVWSAGALFLGLKAVRFMEFLAIPAAIVISFGFFAVMKYYTDKKRTKVAGRIIYVICAISLYAVLMMWKPVIACLLATVVLTYGFWGSGLRKDYAFPIVLAIALFMAPLVNCQVVTTRTVPLFEKPTEQLLSWIQEETPETVVVADFWSFGYIYQYYAGRRTIADGGTYNGAYFYWLANMLTTDNENLSVGIARMLQGSGLDGTSYACDLCGTKREACELLKMILPLHKEDAEVLLLDRFTEEQTKRLLEYTHPKDCPPIYYVMNYHIFRASAGLLYFSEWDFTGGMDVENYSQGVFLGQQAIDKPVPGDTAECEIWKKGFESGWKVIVEAKEEGILAKLVDPNGQRIDVRRYIYVKDGKKESDELAVASDEKFLEEYALIVVEENGSLSVVMCEKSLPDSVLFKLYLYGGEGQSVFSKVYEGLLPVEISGETSLTQRRIGSRYTRDYVGYGISAWKVETGKEQ